MIFQMKMLFKNIFIYFVFVLLACEGGCRAKPPLPEKSLVGAPSIQPDDIASSEGPIRYVVLISLDGLGAAWLEPLLTKKLLPHFARFQKLGATTLDARADVTDTTTMANHTCMLTGLPSDPPSPHNQTGFHGYHFNKEPPVDATLHNAGNPALSYIPSVFDVAHDFGKRTCMYATKSKFVLFARSYDGENGRPDTIGPDNGKNKLDVVLIENNSDALVGRFSADIQNGSPCNFSFVHLAELDATGHGEGWGSEAWNAEAVHLDHVLGRLIAAVDAVPLMKNRTAFVLTADHGGVDKGHGDTADIRNFAVPFFVMGPGIPAGVDLYKHFASTRQPPGLINPFYGAKITPIRNGEAGNFALSLLGLPPIPGSLLYGMR